MINTNLHPISHHFQVIADYWSNLHFRQRLPICNTLVQGPPKLRTTKFGLKILQTLFYRVVQSAFQYHEPFRYGPWVWQTDVRTDRQSSVSHSAVQRPTLKISFSEKTARQNRWLSSSGYDTWAKAHRASHSYSEHSCTARNKSMAVVKMTQYWETDLAQVILVDIWFFSCWCRLTSSSWRRTSSISLCTVILHLLLQVIDWVRFNVPLNTLQVILGTGFYGSNDPTNSVKALKEDVQGLGFNLTRSTPPCYNNTTKYNTALTTNQAVCCYSTSQRCSTTASATSLDFSQTTLEWQLPCWHPTTSWWRDICKSAHQLTIR